MGSEVEFFLIIVEGFAPFAFAMGNSILVLAGLLDSPLFSIIIF